MKKKIITFHYYSEKHIASQLIKIRLSTMFSHVSIGFGEDGLYHSTMMQGTHREDAYDGQVKFTSAIEVSEEGYAKALSFVREACGSVYDFKAILGFIIGKRLTIDNNYFCSELARIVFEKATGVELKLYTLVTPGQMRLISETYRLSS